MGEHRNRVPSVLFFGVPWLFRIILAPGTPGASHRLQSVHLNGSARRNHSLSFVIWPRRSIYHIIPRYAPAAHVPDIAESVWPHRSQPLYQILIWKRAWDVDDRTSLAFRHKNNANDGEDGCQRYAPHLSQSKAGIDNIGAGIKIASSGNRELFHVESS